MEKHSVAIFVATLGYFATFTLAQRHPLTDIPSDGQGIRHTEWFPEHFSLHFPAGDQVEVIVGLDNSGDQAYNVTAIYGSLNAAHNYNLFFQNFSGLPYYETLRPGEQVSLSYTFQTAQNLPPREFLVALTVFYNTETQGFATTFFNSTIDITEKPALVDIELFFLWVLLLGLLGGAGYLLYTYLTSIGWIKKARKGKSSRKVEPSNLHSSTEWLQGTFYSSTKPSRKSSKDIRRTGEPKEA